jgi:hypothetical protein
MHPVVVKVFHNLFLFPGLRLKVDKKKKNKMKKKKK